MSMFLQVLRLFCKKYLCLQPSGLPLVAHLVFDMTDYNLAMQDHSENVLVDVWKHKYITQYSICVLVTYESIVSIKMKHLSLLQVVDQIAEISGARGTACGRLVGWLTNLDGLPRKQTVWKKWDLQRTVFFKSSLFSFVHKNCRQAQQIRIARVIQHYIQDRLMLDSPYYNEENMYDKNAVVYHGCGNELYNMQDLSNHDKQDIKFFALVAYNLQKDMSSMSSMAKAYYWQYYNCITVKKGVKK